MFVNYPIIILFYVSAVVIYIFISQSEGFFSTWDYINVKKSYSHNTFPVTLCFVVPWNVVKILLLFIHSCSYFRLSFSQFYVPGSFRLLFCCAYVLTNHLVHLLFKLCFISGLFSILLNQNISLKINLVTLCYFPLN